MQIIDFTEKYISNVLKCGDRHSYESECPEFFKHYKEFYSNEYIKPLSAEMVRMQAKLVRSRLPLIEKNFLKKGICFDKLKLILLVGNNYTNGHAVEYMGNFAPWIPVEAYTSSLAVDVFVTHEVAHAIHYEHNPSWYFYSLEEMHSISRQIITEGLASLVSMEVMGISEQEALWADYVTSVSAKEWVEKCENNMQALYNIVRANFYYSDPSSRLFLINNDGDFYSSRTGYFVGLRAIRQIKERYHLKLVDLLNLEKNEAERMVLEFLKNSKN